jgi:hypothetical protein
MAAGTPSAGLGIVFYLILLGIKFIGKSRKLPIRKNELMVLCVIILIFFANALLVYSIMKRWQQESRIICPVFRFHRIYRNGLKCLVEPYVIIYSNGMKEHLIYRGEENLKKHEILYNVVGLANLSEELISSLTHLQFPKQKTLEWFSKGRKEC